MARKDVFKEDKFGVRFFTYNRKKYFVVNDLNGSCNKHTLAAINRYAFITIAPTLFASVAFGSLSRKSASPFLLFSITSTVAVSTTG